MTALVIILVIIVLGYVGSIVALTTDWRAVFQRHFGDDYHHGEAVQIVNGKRTYFKSELWHEGIGACSYWRSAVINGKKVILDDIAPNPPPGIPKPFDANGRRMYWLIPNGVIASNSEKTAYQFTNYSPEMMSADMEDRVMIGYGHSVKTQGRGGCSMGLIIGFVAILAVAGLLFILLRPQPGRVPVAPTSNTTANATAPAPNFQPGQITIGPPPTGGK